MATRGSTPSGKPSVETRGQALEPKLPVTATSAEPSGSRRSTSSAVELSKPIRAWVVLLVLAVSLLPILTYSLVFGGIPAVDPLEARRQLATLGSQVVLVDVRPADAFAVSHLSGAVNWPLADILATASREIMPSQLQNRRLLLICDSGIKSALAARLLQSRGVEASNIHGGLQSWVATALKPGGSELMTFETATGEQAASWFQQLSPSEQTAAAVATVLIKPAYMLLAAVLIGLLWTRRAIDLVSLRWGLIFFLAGESACVVNIAASFLTGEQSDLFEYLHGLGMALALGFMVFALLHGLDWRVVKVSDTQHRCALLGVCQTCYKSGHAPCGLRRLFLLLTPAVALLAFMPLSAQPYFGSTNASIFGVPYNYTHPGIHQWFEGRFLPIVAFGLLMTSFVALLISGDRPFAGAQVLFAAGAGALAYSMLMLALLAMYQENLLWFVFWEEGTELLLIAAAAGILWVFRGGLIPGRTSSQRGLTQSS